MVAVSAQSRNGRAARRGGIAAAADSVSRLASFEDHNGGRRSDPTLIIVDVDNVHGTSDLRWTHGALIEVAIQWRNNNTAAAIAASSGSADNATNASVELSSLALVVNHGGVPCLYTGGPLDDRVGIFFSGDDQKTDDVIVSLVRAAEQQQAGIPGVQTVKVVTADQDLKDRCRQAAALHNTPKLSFVEPIMFIDEIAALSEHDYTLALRENDTSIPASSVSNGNNTAAVNTVTDQIRREVALRQELQMLDRMLHPRGMRANGKKRRVSKKQRMKLTTRRDRVRERLHELLLLVNKEASGTLKSVLQTDTSSTTSNGVVQATEASRISAFSIEGTYERQLLTERLRRQLDRAGATRCSLDADIDWAPVHEVLWNAKRDRSCPT